jgi:hypothetical protein
VAYGTWFTCQAVHSGRLTPVTSLVPFKYSYGDTIKNVTGAKNVGRQLEIKNFRKLHTKMCLPLDEIYLQRYGQWKANLPDYKVSHSTRLYI